MIAILAISMKKGGSFQKGRFSFFFSIVDEAGLSWWGTLGDSAPLVLKKLFVRGAQGALKISQVLNCERLAFRAVVLKLVGVKDLQGGHEHSSD